MNPINAEVVQSIPTPPVPPRPEIWGLAYWSGGYWMTSTHPLTQGAAKAVAASDFFKNRPGLIIFRIPAEEEAMPKLNPREAPRGYRAVEGQDCTGCAFDTIQGCNRPARCLSCVEFWRSDSCRVIFKKLPRKGKRGKL